VAKAETRSPRQSKNKTAIGKPTKSIAIKCGVFVIILWNGLMDARLLPLAALIHPEAAF
jgi:hypothetical protein